MDALNWVRGGAWEANGLDALLAPEDLSTTNPTMMGVAGDLLRSDPNAWDKYVGKPYGLERYQPAPRDIHQMLEQISRIVVMWGNWWKHWSSEGTGDDRASVAADICAWLREWGPLGYLPSVTANAPGPATGESSIRFFDIHSEFDQLHGLWTEINEGYKDPEPNSAAERIRSLEQRTSLARRMAQEANQAMVETSIHPVMERSEVRFEPTPLTLRALIWLSLFQLIGTLPQRRCSYCGQEFDQPPKVGRPLERCPEHQASRYRKAVYEGRAPIQRSHRLASGSPFPERLDP